jgi:uncharacterized protein YlaI
MRFTFVFTDHRVCTYCGQENAILTAFLFRNGPIQVLSCTQCGGSLANAARRLSLGLFHFETGVTAAQPKKAPLRAAPFHEPRKQESFWSIPLKIFFTLGITMLMLKIAVRDTPDIAYIGYLFVGSLLAVAIGLTNRWHKKAILFIFAGAVMWLGGFISMFWLGILGAQIGTAGTMLVCFTSVGSRFLADD